MVDETGYEFEYYTHETSEIHMITVTMVKTPHVDRCGLTRYEKINKGETVEEVLQREKDFLISTVENFLNGR